MKKYLIILVSILIDGLIPNITLFNFNNITYFTPLCTAVSLIFLYENNKTFYKLITFTIIIYAGLYVNNLILAIIIFIIIIYIIHVFKKCFKDNIFTVLIQVLIVICTWDLLFFLFDSIFIIKSFIWSNYLYKISHSLILNIIYGLILYKVFNEKF